MEELDATCSMELWSIPCSMGLGSIAAPVSSFCL